MPCQGLRSETLPWKFQGCTLQEVAGMQVHRRLLHAIVWYFWTKVSYQRIVFHQKIYRCDKTTKTQTVLRFFLKSRTDYTEPFLQSPVWSLLSFERFEVFWRFGRFSGSILIQISSKNCFYKNRHCRHFGNRGCNNLNKVLDTKHHSSGDA